MTSVLLRPSTRLMIVAHALPHSFRFRINSPWITGPGTQEFQYFIRRVAVIEKRASSNEVGKERELPGTLLHHKDKKNYASGALVTTLKAKHICVHMVRYDDNYSRTIGFSAVPSSVTCSSPSFASSCASLTACPLELLTSGGDCKSSSFSRGSRFISCRGGAFSPEFDAGMGSGTPDDRELGASSRKLRLSEVDAQGVPRGRNVCTLPLPRKPRALNVLPLCPPRKRRSAPRKRSRFVWEKPCP